MINRRTLLTTALTLGAMKAFPGLSYAQARPLVFATFTGSWEEAHKAVLVPAFRNANADASIVLDPMLSVDQIAKVVRRAGAKNIEGPQIWPDYSPGYYALFFEDPDGNKLEVCCRASPIAAD